MLLQRVLDDVEGVPLRHGLQAVRVGAIAKALSQRGLPRRTRHHHHRCVLAKPGAERQQEFPAVQASWQGVVDEDEPGSTPFILVCLLAEGECQGTRCGRREGDIRRDRNLAGGVADELADDHLLTPIWTWLVQVVVTGGLTTTTELPQAFLPVR